MSRLRLAFFVSLAVFALAGISASSAMAIPANDNFSGRQAISGALPITVAANNIGATAESGEPDIFSNSAEKSVWFSWTAPAAGEMVIDQCSAGFTGDENPFIGIAVRTGTTLPALVLVKETAGRCLLRFHANSGVTYNFQVDYRSSEGNFNFKLRLQAPPANDKFASATAIGPALPVTQNGTTVDSTYEAGEPASLGGSSSSRSVWYSWTASTTGRVRLGLCDLTYVDGPLNNATIVYTGSTLGTLVPIASLTSNDCVMDFPVVAGTNYKIAVSGNIAGDFNFVLTLQAAPQPTNDNFADAQAVGPGLPLSAPGNNDFATTEAGEPNHGGYSPTSRSVWFKWTAGQTGAVRLKACSRDGQFFTSVYTGTLISALTEAGAREYFAPCSNYFDAVAGTTYMIAVAGGPFNGTHGPFTLDIHQVAIPGNDGFESAVNLGSKVTASTLGTTIDSTVEENEPAHAASYGSTSGSVWFRWKAPNDNPVVLQSCSTVEPNRITVYRDDPEAVTPGISGLLLIDDDTDGCRGGTKGGRLAIAPVKGTSYYIAVSPVIADYESRFTFDLKGTATAKSPFNLKKAIAKCLKLKGKKKQTSCIKAARKKAALIKCKKIKNGKSRAKCVKSANKRFK